MKTAVKPALGDIRTIHMLPRWVTSAQGEAVEIVAFQSGATLTVLDGLASDPSLLLPVKLLATRLALKTAASKQEAVDSEHDIYNYQRRSPCTGALHSFVMTETFLVYSILRQCLVCPSCSFKREGCSLQRAFPLSFVCI